MRGAKAVASRVEIHRRIAQEYLKQGGAYDYRSHQLATATDGSDGERLTIKLACNGQGAVLSPGCHSQLPR